ncbi:hypothetical protein [Dyella acidisoli]|uniref:Uncharacterized protein n=1 Tax=Dyella acidisoli TaxID=1867834 RepID=A0ABQ5XJA2_9GAMM|nr:hypothetical protein [Dyella acidisoli]GLQ91261.1 hypothetical protein GCM10007901_02110 [Dyella acidisoli]
MNYQSCDIYLPRVTKGLVIEDAFKIIRDINFNVDIDKDYSGFLGLNIRRMQAMMAVMRLRDVRVPSLSVPTKYREEAVISSDEAIQVASSVNLPEGVSVVFSWRNDEHNPMYWIFDKIYPNEERPGASLLIDKVDRHVWSNDEVDEYQHDFNNAFWR